MASPRSPSTAIVLRTIATIAREEGENLADPRTRLACLEVFALGHTGLAAPDGAAGGYFALRVLLARGLALAADTLMRSQPVQIADLPQAAG